MARSTLALLMPLLVLACGSGKHGSPHAAAGDGGVDGGGVGGRDSTEATPEGGAGAQATSEGGAGATFVDEDLGGAPLGMGGESGAPSPVSKYCGDAIRDPRTEACDDGPGDADDSCSSSCSVTNMLVVDGDRANKRSRHLGLGAHPLAGGSSAAAIVFEETIVADTSLYLSRITDLGQRTGAPLLLSAGLAPDEQSNPVVAALPDDRFIAAWSDKSGGTLDVVLRPVSASNAIGDVVIANQKLTGAQYDPDLLWTADQLVVTWTDGFDVKLRSFSSELAPVSDALTLSSGAFAGDATLAAHASGWAAAFREAAEAGGEQMSVVLQDGTRFVVGPLAAGPSGDHPALVSLDSTHLLLVYTSSTNAVAHLHGALLDAQAPSEIVPVELPPALSPYNEDPSLAQRRPALTKIGDQIVLSWQSSSPIGDERGEELFLRRLSWSADAAASLELSGETSLLVDWTADGTQAMPAIAAARLHRDDVLLSVFEQASVLESSKVVPDLVLGFSPWPASAIGQEDKP